MILVQVLEMCCNAEEIKDYLKYFLIICHVSRDKSSHSVPSAGFYQRRERSRAAGRTRASPGFKPRADAVLIITMFMKCFISLPKKKQKSA